MVRQPISTVDYLRTRFPLHSNGAAVVGCFLCSVLGYELAAEGRVRLQATEFLGALTMVLLFLHLRVVDDLDDLPTDVPPAALPDARRRLIIGLVVVELAVVLLNVAWPGAIAMALAAMALAVLTPFVVKPLSHANRLVIAPCYEAAPLLVLAYGYFHWAGVTGQRAPVPAVLGLLGAFWATYEFWKFSRKAGEDAYQPYGLADPGLKVVLVLLLAAMSAGVLAFAIGADRSWFVLAYGCVVPPGFAAWLMLRWPQPGTHRRGRWRGLLLVETLILTIGVETLLSELGWR